ncbi:OmpH family outer membrane protein [bacterium]|nr:OmpH family outer membrane protein [bacterium]
MIKSKELLSMIAVAFLVTIFSIGVEGAPVIKIGFVDQQAVFEKSKMGQNTESKMKALQDKKNSEIDKMQSEIEELDRKIKNKDLPLIDSQREEFKKERRKKEIDLKYFIDGANDEGNQLGSQLLKKFDEKVKEIVKKVSEEGGYSLVIEKTGIIFYGNPEFDITDKVIAEMNKTTQ